MLAMSLNALGSDPKADIAHFGFVPILLQKSAMTGAWPVARRS